MAALTGPSQLQSFGRDPPVSAASLLHHSLNKKMSTDSLTQPKKKKKKREDIQVHKLTRSTKHSIIMHPSTMPNRSVTNNDIIKKKSERNPQGVVPRFESLREPELQLV